MNTENITRARLLDLNTVLYSGHPTNHRAPQQLVTGNIGLFHLHVLESPAFIILLCTRDLPPMGDSSLCTMHLCNTLRKLESVSVIQYT